MEIRGLVALVNRRWQGSPVRGRAPCVRSCPGPTKEVGRRLERVTGVEVPQTTRPRWAQKATVAVILHVVGRPVSPRRYTICRHQPQRSASWGRRLENVTVLTLNGLLTSFLHR